MSSHHTAPARQPARLPSYYCNGHDGYYGTGYGHPAPHDVEGAYTA